MFVFCSILQASPRPSETACCNQPSLNPLVVSACGSSVLMRVGTSNGSFVRCAMQLLLVRDTGESIAEMYRHSGLVISCEQGAC